MKAPSDLWESFLDLFELYKEDIPLCKIGGFLLIYTSKILLDNAPSEIEGMDLIKKSIIKGINWSKSEKEVC